MLAYLDEVKGVMMKIKDFKIFQIPKEENKMVVNLAKSQGSQNGSQPCLSLRLYLRWEYTPGVLTKPEH